MNLPFDPRLIPRPEVIAAEIDRRACVRLAEFARRAWHVLEPSTPLKWGWALDAICEHLEAVTRGEITRLLINCPPGTMKSLLAGVIWPAWEWGPMKLPGHRFMGTAHKQDLAIRDNMKCRRLIKSEWYQARWPIALVGDQDARTKFENDATGFREAMAFTSMTGSRGDRCLVGSTIVETSDGPKTIKEIVVSAKACYVMAYDEHSKRLVQRPIEAVARRTPARVYRVHTASGRVADCTADHRWYTQRGYVEAGFLSEGDAILCAVPQGICADGCGGQKEELGRSIADLLQQPMFDNIRQHEAWQNRSELQCVRCEDAQGVGQTAVLQSVRRNRQGSMAPDRLFKEVKPAGCTLRGMRDACSTEDRDEGAKILLPVVQERCALQDDEGGGQSWLAGRRGSCPVRAGSADSLQQDAPADYRAGRADVREMPFVKRVDRSSYRHGRGQQFPYEFGDALRCLSHGLSCCGEIKTIFDRVVMVEDLCREEVVYDIQVEGTRNFFANGLLSHNCLLDDPHSVDDAYSPKELANAIRTFREALPSRVNNDESAIVIIMQRLHEKDVSSVALDLGYQHLSIPMRFEAKHVKPWPNGGRDPRTSEGELMFPERFGPAYVEALEKSLGTYGTAGQLQQRPAPLGGGLFKRHWFAPIHAMPAGPRRRVRAWDLAATEATTGSDPDWTAGLRMSKGGDGLFIIESVRRLRGTPAAVEAELKLTAAADGTQTAITLPQDPGQAGKSQAQQLVRMLAGYPVSAKPVTGSKVQRAAPVMAQAEAGNVRLLVTGDPAQDAWIEAFLAEVETFPAGAHDDQVDAMSDAFNELALGSAYSLDAL